MKLNIDSQPIEIPCPSCGKKLNEQIGRVKRSPTLTCHSCRQSFAIDAHQLRRVLESAQKAADQLGRSLGKLGK